MATVLDYVNEVRAKLALLSPAISTQTTNSDYRTDLDALSAGATHYRIRHQEQQADADSNQNIQGAALELEISHRLVDPFAERTYTEGDMLTHQAALLDRSWWRTASVRSIGEDGGPNINDDVNREGNVISWSVLVLVTLKP